MRSVRVQLLVVLGAVVVAAALVAIKGLPPRKSIYGAAAAGDIVQASRILDWGADVNDKNNAFPGTALHEAAIWDHKEMVEFLLARGANVNARDWGGQTPLHWAVGSERTDVVQLLIARGADVNARGVGGGTPLTKAMHVGNSGMAEFLRQHGAKE